MAGTNEDRDRRELRFRRLYQAYFRPVQAYAVNRLGPVDEVADIVAEVFMTAWRRLADVPPSPSVIASGFMGRPAGSSPGGIAAPAACTTCLAVSRPNNAPRFRRWNGQTIQRGSACLRRSAS